MEGIVVSDIIDHKALNYFILAIVLADATNSNSQSAAKEAVPDADISAVAFQRQTVVSVVDGPVREGDAGGAYGIGPVRVGFVPNCILSALFRRRICLVLDLQPRPVLLTRILSRVRLWE